MKNGDSEKVGPEIQNPLGGVDVMLPISQAAINGVMSLSFIHFFSKTAGGR